MGWYCSKERTAEILALKGIRPAIRLEEWWATKCFRDVAPRKHQACGWIQAASQIGESARTWQ